VLLPAPISPISPPTETVIPPFDAADKVGQLRRNPSINFLLLARSFSRCLPAGSIDINVSPASTASIKAPVEFTSCWRRREASASGWVWSA
jgi:hypothetical protein